MTSGRSDLYGVGVLPPKTAATSLVNDEGDEYVVAETEPSGEMKVDFDGHLRDGREYKIRAFTVPDRGNKLFMLATECAKELQYRDSYLLFNKNKSLFKLLASPVEKEAMIEAGILPYAFRSRQIALVSARSMYRNFGARIIVNGRRVKDDYWERLAKEAGFEEHDLPTDRLPHQPAPSHHHHHHGVLGPSSLDYNSGGSGMYGNTANAFLGGGSGRLSRASPGPMYGGRTGFKGNVTRASSQALNGSPYQQGAEYSPGGRASSVATAGPGVLPVAAGAIAQGPYMGTPLPLSIDYNLTGNFYHFDNDAIIKQGRKRKHFEPGPDDLVIGTTSKLITESMDNMMKKNDGSKLQHEVITTDHHNNAVYVDAQTMYLEAAKSVAGYNQQLNQQMILRQAMWRQYWKLKPVDGGEEGEQPDEPEAQPDHKTEEEAKVEQGGKRSPDQEMIQSSQQDSTDKEPKNEEQQSKPVDPSSKEVTNFSSDRPISDQNTSDMISLPDVATAPIPAADNNNNDNNTHDNDQVDVWPSSFNLHPQTDAAPVINTASSLDNS